MIDTESHPGAWQRALDRGCLQQFPGGEIGSSVAGKAPRAFTLLVGAGCLLAAAIVWLRSVADPDALDEVPMFIGGGADNANHGERN